MAVLQAKKLKQALEKARRVGVVEEAVTVAGCPLVFSSLPPDAYEQIQEEVKDLEEVAYLHAFQIGHLCRSIVELDHVDLRGVDFVEVEEEDGRPIRVEKHAWVRDHFLRTWSRESITAAWRKMMEVFARAEEVAKEGITFSIAEETDEERFRRLLLDMLSSTEELPNELVTKVLDDHGLMSKTSRAEMDMAAEKLAAVTHPEPAAEPTPVPVVDDMELMRNRRPMNQGQVDVPVPGRQMEMGTASRKAEVPAAIREAAVPTQSLSRAAQIAALEGEPGVGLGSKAEARGEAVEGPPIDRPPVRGINPRFQPPRRL